MPGGIVCSVFICKNNSKKPLGNGEKLSFFSFPKDPKIQKEWVRKCYRQDVWNVANKRICSKHFKPEDFEDELQARIMNTQPNRLKKSAVPSLHLLVGKQKHESERSKRMIRKGGKVIEKSLITSTETPPLIIAEPTDETQDKSLSIDFRQISEIPSTSKETDFDLLKKKCEELQNENLYLKKKIEVHENQQKLLQQHISYLEKQCGLECGIDFEEKV